MDLPVKMDEHSECKAHLSDLRKVECNDWIQFHHALSSSDDVKRNVSSPDQLQPLPLTNPNLSTNQIRTVQQWSVIVNSSKKLPIPNQLPNVFNPLEPPLTNEHGRYNQSNSGIFNSITLCENSSDEIQVIKEQRKGISYMRQFVKKLQRSLEVEKKFLHSKIQNGRNSGSSTSLQSASSEHGYTNESRTKHKASVPKLPKLGRVHVELRTCMKTSEEICALALHTKLPYSMMIIENLTSLQRNCHNLKEKMLLYLRWLIEARLLNISSLVSLYYDVDNFSLDDILSPNENKRFCKLFEVYNDYASRFLKCDHERDIKVHLNAGKHLLLNGNNTSTGVNSNEVYGRGISHQWNLLSSRLVQPLSVRHILDILSSRFLQSVGEQVSFIFNSCQNLTLVDNLKKPKNPVVNPAEVWADASRIEVRPVHPSNNHKSSFFRVIKRVAGVNVPDIDMSEASKKCGSLTVQFTVQENIISNFITGLNSKAKLLRKSYNFQDAYNSDDAVSIASSENTSVSSSMMRHSEVKSVTWHDSWNTDAVRSLSAYYREHLTGLIPSCYSSYSSLVKLNQNGSNKDFLDMSLQNEISLLLLRSVVANLEHLDVMGDDIHNSLLLTATDCVVQSALSCSDNIFCQMLGKCSVSCDRNSMQKSPDSQLTMISHLAVSALQPLLHVMEMYPSHDSISKEVIPRVEGFLTAIFYWIEKKIQNLFASWSLASLLQISLCDLREITNVSLDCLRLVEACHNYLETKRNANSTALHMATQYLHRIDNIITNMQVSSGTNIKNLKSESFAIAYTIISENFPPQKKWMQRHLINTEEENKYAQDLIEKLISPAASAVKEMDSQSQLAALTPVTNSVFDSCLMYIAKHKVKFSAQGALQLSCDFSTMINYLTSNIDCLTHEVQVSLSSLHSVKRANNVALLLQSSNEYTNEAYTDDRFLPDRNTSSSTTTLDEEDEKSDEEYSDKFWLSLRSQHVRKRKKWSTLIPCIDNN